jgi:hypothetical protein
MYSFASLTPALQKLPAWVGMQASAIVTFGETKSGRIVSNLVAVHIELDANSKRNTRKLARSSATR